MNAKTKRLRSWALGVALSALSALGCGKPAAGVLPPRVGPPVPAELVLVWVGHGEAERLDLGTWRRVPDFDYEFTVEQRRYADHWESVKHMRRRHPSYDGSAGPREQTMFFRVDLASAPSADGNVALRIDSSLGTGTGVADRDFGESTLELRAAVSALAPFDTYRIAQKYAYAEGVLTETVALDKGRAPWVRNRETATLFAPHRFAEPPTRATLARVAP